MISECQDLLPQKEAAVLFSCTGKLIYFYADRVDVMLIVRELAQELQKPTKLAMLKLKHLAKFLKGTWDWCWSYLYQDPPKGFKGYGDSDWAADEDVQKSVSCDSIFHGSNFIEGWVSGQ